MLKLKDIYFGNTDAKNEILSNSKEEIERFMPIRLTHTPTTCWMYPVARIKRGIGRRLGPACDSQQ